MADNDRLIVQALREIAQEMRLMRRTIEGIDKRLATLGGLTAATTRQAHLVAYDGRVHCSACGGICGEWLGDASRAVEKDNGKCKHCGALLEGEVEAYE